MSGKGKTRGSGAARTRETLSGILRDALRRERDRLEREEQEERDRKAFRAHRDKLRCQARALISEQAER